MSSPNSESFIAQAKAAFRIDPGYLEALLWDAHLGYRQPLKRNQNHCKCGEPKMKEAKSCRGCWKNR